MTTFFVTTDDTRLAYDIQGDGVPVIALAGLTRNMADFDHVAPHLTGVQLIRMDYRGRGQSDWADPETYTVPQESADVIALMDHLGLSQAAILGTSRGGLIGMGLAAYMPDRILGVCLNDVGPVITQTGLAHIKSYVGNRPKQKTYEEAAAFRAEYMTAFRNVPHERWLSEVKAHYVERDNGLHLRYDSALKQQFANFDSELPDLWPVFDLAAQKPMAVIRGENSDILSPETYDEMRRRAPNMIATTVPDRGHVPFLDEPESLNAITAWLAQIT